MPEANQSRAELTTACCGIDCTGCGIRQAASDREKAKQEADAWRRRGFSDASPDWFKCQGCHGPDGVVWSAKCNIRRCCLSERELLNCSLCDDFPCDHVRAFENDGNRHHAAAVQRLRRLRTETS